MELFYGRVSGNSSRALFGLFESGAPFTPRLVDIDGGENKSPAYLAVNPMGKIPALADGEFRLWESNAINLYVAEKFPEARLMPKSLEARASVQRWLFFQAAHLTPSCIPVFRATHPKVQEFWKTKGDPAAADAGRKDLARWLPVLEEALAGRDWLDGQFSLADIAHTPHLLLVRDGGFDFAKYPGVRDWLARCEARPAWKKTWELVFS
jgi:glutathione S-transferase